MSTTEMAPPAARETAVPATAAPVAPSRSAAIRAFGVMLGGPLALLTAVIAAILHSARALRAGRLPGAGALAVLGGAAVYGRWLRPWLRRWGATDAEAEAALPGDELCPAAPFRHTHVVQIDAGAEAVWPWIAQIGQDRGGFYSYTWLENLAGCRMRNAGRIHPEWQSRRVGETVLLHPSSGLRIRRLEPGRALVLEGGWSLVIEPDAPDSCRLFARFCAPSGATGAAYALLLELPHFLMERRMLLEIKRLAEGES